LLDILEPGQDNKSAPAVGIDLGTTHSLVAVSKDGETRVLQDEMGCSLMPSVVAYCEDATIVGVEAQMQKLALAGQVVSSVKRLMGKSLEDVAKIAPFFSVPLVGDDQKVLVDIMGEQKTPVEVSAEILKSLKKLAEEDLGEDVYDAVITVPAYFDDAQRQATKDAAKIAGLNVLRLIAEPTAAALAYGLEKGKEGTYLVYDLGGGTFDVSILKLKDGAFKVLATGGDTHFGGDDFDRRIAHKFDISMDEAKTLKEALCNGQPSGPLDKATFIDLIAATVRQSFNICIDVLMEAKLKKKEIDGLVLVGGSTKIPHIKEGLEQLFDKKCEEGINPEEVVACGAALQAESLTHGRRDDMLLLDVVPLSLGVETMGSLVEKIIPRNTPIPITKVQEFTTFKDNQSGMDIHVLQGERETVDGCRSLAKLSLKGIPPMPAGAGRVKVVFSVDADGILTVTAQEETTGVSQQVEVTPTYGLSDEEMVEMLKDSIAHAKDDVTARSVREARLELERLCDACYASLQKDGNLIDDEEAKGYEQSVDAAQIFLEMDDVEAIEEAIEVLERTFKPFAEKRMDYALKEALVGEKLDDKKQAAV